MIKEGNMNNMIRIAEITDADREWVGNTLIERWGAVQLATRGKIHQADRLPGFIAVYDGNPSGLITLRFDGSECEIISLNSFEEGIGIGRALLDAAKNTAISKGCKRLWLITTNDNLKAIRFYQIYGFTITAIHANSIEELRKLKPAIPLIGIDGIPIRDEVELEIAI
jgi:ribosomal protein S18 acetylase RimI-like enzyme